MSSESDFEALLKMKADLTRFHLKKNPFTITPLFSDLDDEEKSKRDQRIFFKRLESEIAIKALGPGRRLLIYGDIGVGKTSILNLLLYITKNRDLYLPVKILVSEDNVTRAVQNILYTVCIEIIRKLKARDIKHPLQTAKRWILEKRKGDRLYDYMAHLIGPYEEEKVVATKRRGTVGGELGTGIIPGGSIKGETWTEESIETRLKSYVDSLPAKTIEQYFKDIVDITRRMGYTGLIIGIDEADHIRDIQKVVGMLTVARSIFFLSDEATFIVAGSNELVKSSSSITEGVFDTLIPLKPLDLDGTRRMLEKRVKEENRDLSLVDIFDADAIEEIHRYGRGLPKPILRFAENVLTEAAASNASRVHKTYVFEVLGRIGAQIQEILDTSERKVVEALQELREASPSSKELQTSTSLSRAQLDRILRVLYERRIVDRAKKGKAYFYRVPVAFGSRRL